MQALLTAIRRDVPGLMLCVVLAIAGQALVGALALPLPGAIIGLLVYLGLLLAGRGVAWSRPGAAQLLRWLGALVVPVLIGLQAYAGALAGAVLPLALLLIATTLVTALATALIFRLAGGRDAEPR
jgi:holin-like protein